MATTTFELKLLIEKKSQKVLFTEVSKDVVDLLFSLLSLPIGSVAKVIAEESTFEPLRNTYRSWEQLDSSLLSSTNMTANSLIPVISPTSSSNFSCFLTSVSPATVKEKVYVCTCRSSFSDELQTTFQCCYNLHTYASSYVGPHVTTEKVERDGYVKAGVTYFVMDDLSIVPMTPLASIALVSKMGHNDFSLPQEKTVNLDVQQGLELLKTSFKSKNVLTDMFLAKKK